ncbi:hypothetical protein [Cellulomonas sp. C5510]|uniref:hypothetical protein n=1 Tax=Cellulomonas sp. C5510 TaxID=2871170 RepID=UPI001C945595|nr:hypothetical protein [Cellulomonas sp. C5510]QZN85604.1 hypothetical protein K5O09_18045 [Cellulomonas sp. C5510]
MTRTPRTPSRRRRLLSVVSVVAATTLAATLGGAATAAYVDVSAVRTAPMPAELGGEPPEQRTGLALGSRMVDTGVGVTAAGRVVVWGLGMYGINGTPNAEMNIGPTVVAGLPEVVQVATGIYSLNALGADGTVWGWGDCSRAAGTDLSTAFTDYGCSVGAYGSPAAPPRQVRIGARASTTAAPLLDRVTAIASTEYAGAALRDDCTVWHWGGHWGDAVYQYGYGGNGLAQLGASKVKGLPDPTRVAGACPTSVVGGYDTFWIILENGDVYYLGGRTPLNTTVNGNPSVAADQVATGASLSARPVTALQPWLLRTVGADRPHVVSVAGGIQMGGALLSDGSVLSWSTYSADRTGRSAPGTSWRTPGPVTGLGTGVVEMAFGFTGAAFLKSNGELWCYGAGDDYARCPTTPTRLATGVTQFGVGQGFTIWQTADGVFSGRGYNPRGAIGLPTGVAIGQNRVVSHDLSMLAVTP